MRPGKVFGVVFGVFVAIVFAAGIVHATVINVPADYPKVQEAIDAATSGDTVLVAGGRYAPTTNGEAFPINMKNGVRLLGAGAEACTLDAEHTHRVIYCSSISDTTTRIEGFTITNGQSTGSLGGGGICCDNNSSPAVTNNVITGNSAGVFGGGIFCYGHSNPTITNNIITGNSAGSGGGGGGICCIYHSSPTVTNNVISGNSAGYYGGGGICCRDYSSPTITNNVITGNSAENGGGMFCRYYSSPTITNNVIAGNSASVRGGGICLSKSFPTITNSVITGNSAPVRGGIDCYWGSSPTITYDDVWGNTPDNYGGCLPGAGCISDDPLFVDPSIGDYHLQSGSPCTDAGDNNAPGLPEFDFDGNLRIMDGDGDGIAIVDMGPFEFLLQPPELFIVEEELSVSYAPPNPWVQQEFAGLEFKVTAVGTSLTHVRFFSDPLQHESLPKKIPDDLVEFIPQEIGFLAEHDTAQVIVKIEIPIGQHEGDYSGYFRAVCSEGYSDRVAVTVTIEPSADIDFDREKVALTAPPGGSDSDVCMVVNPNSWDNNPDGVDGPGNVDLGSISYQFTELVGPGGTIPSSAISVSDNQPSLGSGASDEVTIAVDVPSDQLAGEYNGKVYVSGTPVPTGLSVLARRLGSSEVIDSLTLEVTVLPKRALNIVQSSISATVMPMSPWVEPLSAGFGFDVENTGNDTLRNVTLSSTDLSLDNRDPIYAYTVAFDPPLLGWIEPGGVRHIEATVPVPIGHYNGTYSGSFSGVSGNLLGSEDEVAVSLSIEPLNDLDIEDYAGNLSANRMVLYGVKGGVAVGVYHLVNPNGPENNVDLYDGPGNDDIISITAGTNDLIPCGGSGKCTGIRTISLEYNGTGTVWVELKDKKIVRFDGWMSPGDTATADASPGKLGNEIEVWVEGECLEKIHTSCAKPINVGDIYGDFTIVYLDKVIDQEIPKDNIDANVGGVTYITSGGAEMFVLQVSIPKKGVNEYDPVQDKSYCGAVSVIGQSAASSDKVADSFVLELRVLTVETGEGLCGFWGESGPDGNVLSWNNFGLNETGYTLYRRSGVQFHPVAELSSGLTSYTDHNVLAGLVYEYKLGVAVSGSEIMIGPITLNQSKPLPVAYRLSEAHPNPLRDETSIKFSLPVRTRCSLRLYDSAGRLVRSLLDEDKEPGIYSVIWDGKNGRGELVCNGVYFYHLEAGDFTSTKKMVLLK